jgi:hypothetical protein
MRSLDCRLRIYPERCNKKEDGVLKGYYNELKTGGPPFDPTTSEKYRPLAAEEFNATLLEFLPKAKTSPMVQFADLYLWPMCMGGLQTGQSPVQAPQGVSIGLTFLFQDGINERSNRAIASRPRSVIRIHTTCEAFSSAVTRRHRTNPARKATVKPCPSMSASVQPFG